jgi:Protein of unknown function (DUF3788)
MEPLNAFIGEPEYPGDSELAAALGKTANLWTEFISSLSDDLGVNVKEWKSYTKTSGWTLRLKLKKRAIVYLAPCHDCFRVAFILGPRAVEAAAHAHLPKNAAQALAQGSRYPEGTGLRLVVRGPRDMPGIRKLAAIKLAN